MRFLTLGMNYLLVYGMYPYATNNNPKHLSDAANGIYSGTSRTLWAVNLCWIIFESLTGNGGWLQRLVLVCCHVRIFFYLKRDKLDIKFELLNKISHSVDITMFCHVNQ